jgi:RNA-directed DNA polymerase
MWLKAPAEERDSDGTRRMTGGKSCKHGTPQGGVISPLPANLYINRFLKHWCLTEMIRAFRAHVVSYADDPGSRWRASLAGAGPVILSRGHADEASWRSTLSA